MSRPPSDATQVRHLTRRLNIAIAELDKVIRERNGYRTQAAVLSDEVTDWKRRFDALLKILPESESSSASRKASDG